MGATGWVFIFLAAVATLAAITGQPVKALGIELGTTTQRWARVVLFVLAIVFVFVAFNVRNLSRPSRADYVHQVEAVCANAGNTRDAATAIRNLDTPTGNNNDIAEMLQALDKLTAAWNNYEKLYNAGQLAEANAWLSQARTYARAADAAAEAAGIDCLTLGR